MNPASDRLPGLQLLSNDSYHVMVTCEGVGFSRWKALAVSRWREDATGDGLGSFCYLRDALSGAVWSTTVRPTGRQDDLIETTFTPGRATLVRRHIGSGVDIETRTDIAVSPDLDVELRRVGISNHAVTSRTLSLTSYMEVVLQAASVDAAHPAFEKLFAETEILPQFQAIVCTRRPRDPAEPTLWMFHLLLPGEDPAVAVSYESDRMRFIGRGRSAAQPLSLETGASLSGTAGAVLDPVAAIRCQVTIDPARTVNVDLVSGVASTREGCLELVRLCREPGFADRLLDTAVVRAHAVLKNLNLTEVEAKLCAHLAWFILYANAALRAPSSVLASNRQGQFGLWGYAISGDLPVVLLGVDDPVQIDMARQFVRAHDYWKLHGLTVDLVILVGGLAVGKKGLHAAVLAEIASSGGAGLISQPGGIFVLDASRMPEADQVLLRSVARVVIVASDGPLADQLERTRAVLTMAQPPKPAWAQPAGSLVSPAASASTGAPAQASRETMFDNGLGGFTPDGREYVITVSAGRMTPVPWVNVLANPSFGTLVSESGSATTWSENAQEFRLTPWSNDPVIDANTEAFYIRDEENGHFWSPTLLPAADSGSDSGSYVTRHGFGYSVFDHSERDIASELTMFVAIDAPIKFVVLDLRNSSNLPRSLSVTGYVEWVLGDEQRKTAMHVGTEVDPDCGALFAHNPYNTDFAGRTAFFDADIDGVKPTATSVCGDRCVFLGRDGSLREPAAMSQPRLCGRVGFALDPCGAIRLPVELAPGQTRTIVFRLGADATVEAARQLAQRWRGTAAAQVALAAVKRFWTHTLGAAQVQTPDPAVDILVNGWLVYQTLSCRLWARTAFYQSSGAFGFRDQLQDVMALVHAVPALVREHLLRSASRQFPEGDVQHWWHPPTGRGVRTRCSDDYLWLPLATARYVQVTGDFGVLDEPVDFVVGPLLKEGQVSSYTLPALSLEAAPLYEHCRRAIEHSLHFGTHGLPLMGSCDWNDGMNLVGVAGKGESVWLGFFLYFVLTQFGDLAGKRGDTGLATRYGIESARLRTAIERSGWDGAWYRRAWFDDGSPLGTADNVECRIDSIAQSWSVLSGAGEAQRARLAMDALDRLLVDRDAALVRLLAPPFDHSNPSPGYIQGYVRGVRENGGQYTHAAVWAAMAFAALGDSARAWALLDMLNPIRHSLSPADVAVYQTEPYVVAADVYSLPPHTGRGGWTWYTGSAGWMLRFILESLLGLRVEGNRLRVIPCMPTHWASYQMRYRHVDSLYRINVLNTASAIQGPELTVDGVAATGGAIDLINDGREHEIVVRIHASGAQACRSD